VFWTTARKGGELTGQPHGLIAIRRNQSRSFKTTVVKWVVTNGRKHKHLNYCILFAWKLKIIEVLKSVSFSVSLQNFKSLIFRKIFTKMCHLRSPQYRSLFCNL